jgi:hypothetical protein
VYPRASGPGINDWSSMTAHTVRNSAYSFVKHAQTQPLLHNEVPTLLQAPALPCSNPAPPSAQHSTAQMGVLRPHLLSEQLSIV